MPTYEYVCTDCANHWEEIQKISEPAARGLPQVRKATAKRQISGGNFILKGGGWYADLYSSSPKPKSGGEGEVRVGEHRRRRPTRPSREGEQRRRRVRGSSGASGGSSGSSGAAARRQLRARAAGSGASLEVRRAARPRRAPT